MTRKHFEAIAAGLKRYRKETDMGIKEYTRLLDVMIHTLEDTNPDFDRDRFITAAVD